MTQKNGDEDQKQCSACKRVGEPTASTPSLVGDVEICYACLDEYADMLVEQAREANKYRW